MDLPFFFSAGVGRDVSTLGALGGGGEGFGGLGTVAVSVLGFFVT